MVLDHTGVIYRDFFYFLHFLSFLRCSLIGLFFLGFGRVAVGNFGTLGFGSVLFKVLAFDALGFCWNFESILVFIFIVDCLLAVS